MSAYTRSQLVERLKEGLVIPAHPLALTAGRKLDERHQRALTRYYLAAGAGGIAVGVHTTQFAIRDQRVGLFKPVLELATETVDSSSRSDGPSTVKIAGICGQTAQAVAEAEFAVGAGYHAGLLSLAALKDASTAELAAHAREVAEIIPVMGFYLQPAVGGRVLHIDFWRLFVQIPNVVAIKIAPFNRYQTLDVVRAVAESGRADQIALYTGNDDSIVADLLMPFELVAGGQEVSLCIDGGLLGHWAVWTRRAVEMLGDIRVMRDRGTWPGRSWSAAAHQITDSNAALFDARHGFAGCIAGLHEVLVRQGLMSGRWTLDPEEDLSEGQIDEIDRVYRQYPHLNDDEFVKVHLDEWLQ